MSADALWPVAVYCTEPHEAGSRYLSGETRVLLDIPLILKVAEKTSNHLGFLMTKAEASLNESEG